METDGKRDGFDRPLEAGKLADLIVVDANRLEDLAALEGIEAVVQGGEVVHGR